MFLQGSFYCPWKHSFFYWDGRSHAPNMQVRNANPLKAKYFSPSTPPPALITKARRQLMPWQDYHLNQPINQTLKETYVTSWKTLNTPKGVQSSTPAGYVATGKYARLGLIFMCFWQEYWHSPAQMGARISVFAVDLTEKNEAQTFLSIVWIQSSMW